MESLIESDADGFAWAPPLVEQSPARSTETTSEALDPTLVTSRHHPARDDDAVALLAALKHEPHERALASVRIGGRRAG